MNKNVSIVKDLSFLNVNPLVKIPKGYTKIVETYSSVIKSHGYSKTLGYYFELMPGWESEGYNFIRETNLKVVKELFSKVENVNQLNIYDFLSDIEIDNHE